MTFESLTIDGRRIHVLRPDGDDDRVVIGDLIEADLRRACDASEPLGAFLFDWVVFQVEDGGFATGHVLWDLSHHAGAYQEALYRTPVRWCLTVRDDDSGNAVYAHALVTEEGEVTDVGELAGGLFDGRSPSLLRLVGRAHWQRAFERRMAERRAATATELK